MTLDNVQALPVGTRLGDYRIDAVIGHGGFGITYRALDGQLSKTVAIKEYLPVEFAVRRADGWVVARGSRYAEDFAWGRDRFLDEARALARFRHPHIVPVLRFVEANGTAYTVMEFEDGRSVAELVADPGQRLPSDQVRRLAQGLLSGLAAVHAQGFLHRDIKPSNIIMRRDGLPVLIDFGAARQSIGGRTRTLTNILTPQYAPIEQYTADGKQGPWSDIYSAAAVLHHVIAGRPPPEAASRVGPDDPYRLLARSETGRWDGAFLLAIDRALAFTPERRPQNVAEWRRLFGVSLPLPDDSPTQRLSAVFEPEPELAPEQPATREVSALDIPPMPVLRLSGVTRADELVPGEHRRLGLGPGWVVALVVVGALAVGAWRLYPLLGDRARDFIANLPLFKREAAGATASPPGHGPQPGADGPRTTAAQQALLENAERAATEARRVSGLAMDAASAGNAMRGEARIADARASKPGLENAERLPSDDASYVGQVSDGKRNGFGVAELKAGGRQAGEWKEGQLNGLGTQKTPDDVRYEGQWKAGQPTGYGVLEKSGAERSEGSFLGGRLDGLGRRRLLVDPPVVQAGEWHQGALDGPGSETIGEHERYEGSFRNSKRHGFGQLTGADDKVISGRWEDGRLVERVP